MPVPILKIDEFTRSIAVNRNSPHALFLGAGASITSGVPSAAACIREWKRDIFVTNNPTLRDFVSETSLPSVQRRIDEWLQANDHWPGEDEDDYCYFISKCHRIADNRRRFFEPYVLNASPHIGYQLLCILVESQLIKSVWTTNFDQLVSRAAAAGNAPFAVIEIGPESTHRWPRQPSATELICVSLHGDFRYGPLSNTEDELQEQDAELRKALASTLGSQSLIVSGYSGRDASVMQALEDAVDSSDTPTKLYWCDYGDTPHDAVARLILKAKERKWDAFYVPNASFDDVMTRLAMSCTSGEFAKRSSSIVGSGESSDLPVRESFSVVETEPTDLIKSNAWAIRCPTEVFSFNLTEWPKKKVWKTLEEQGAPHGVIAVPFKQVLALGTLDGIKAAFAGNIDGKVQRVPVSEKDFRYEDGAVVSLMRRAVIAGLAAKHDLATDGKHKLWEKQPFRHESKNGRQFAIHRCMAVGLRSIAGSLYLTVDPTFYLPSGNDSDKDTIDGIRKNLLGYQHNSDYNLDLEYWRNTLCPGAKEASFDFPHSTAAFEFTLDATPAYAAITGTHAKTVEVPEKFQQMVHHKGFQCGEPSLLFSNAKSGSFETDTLPLRGVSSHGPFDFSLSNSPLAEAVRVSVVCPKAEAKQLEAFLSGIAKKWSPRRGNREEYLVPYPGFESAFRVPLELPRTTAANWITIPELTTDDIQAGTRQLARNITDGVETAAAQTRSVVLVFTPSRWDRFRRFETDSESFDVHDFVKAYAVQRGITTQFLKQEKLRPYDDCRFWWWFSVALYTKAMRTPWVLKGLHNRTAYVGLGYSVDSKAQPGKHVVLGCSHLYNARGQGLRFRLSPIDDPIVRGGNPYLTFDAARRVGESIRSLYWDTHQQLPERVVLHKLFPFRLEEMRGLKAGLDGVNELDLLEINHEHHLRYIKSSASGNTFKIDGYPVRRGTVIRLSDFEALLWLHGTTDAVSSRPYFQGKRRIPGPVVVRRYAGSSTLNTLVSELLGLSKMDWNSGALYSQLPATVRSSKSIAQIGSLLERFSSDSFDYRLFM